MLRKIVCNEYFVIFISKSDNNSDTYFDRSGFGSIAATFKDAKAKDKSTTLADVKAWFEQNVDRKRPMSGFNSFIALYAHYGYQLDLLFITNNDLKNQKVRIGLVLIGLLRKFAVVVPLQSKQPPDLLAGTMEGIQNGQETRISIFRRGR